MTAAGDSFLRRIPAITAGDSPLINNQKPIVSSNTPMGSMYKIDNTIFETGEDDDQKSARSQEQGADNPQPRQRLRNVSRPVPQVAKYRRAYPQAQKGQVGAVRVRTHRGSR